MHKDSNAHLDLILTLVGVFLYLSVSDCLQFIHPFSLLGSIKSLVLKTVSLQNSSQNFADNNQGVELNRERRV